MTRLLRCLLCAALAALVTGCANLQSARAPGTDFTGLHTMYVVKSPPDDRGIEKLISARLNTMGYQASYGASDTPPQPVDAVVTYEDKWWWDITMYMMELRVQLRDGSTRSILASAQSHRPSLQRKSPEGMVEEVTNELLKKDAK
ncbi:MAG: hypothetical protein ABI612_05420 [Betaproteobacteria bacterium]